MTLHFVSNVRLFSKWLETYSSFQKYKGESNVVLLKAKFYAPTFESEKLQENIERKKHPCCTSLYAYFKYLCEKWPLKNHVTSEGFVSHNVLYCQHLSITRYQVMFYASNYFE